MKRTITGGGIKPPLRVGFMWEGGSDKGAIRSPSGGKVKETVGEQGNEESGDEDGEEDVLYAVRFHEVMLQAFRLRCASRFSRAKEAEMRILVGGELGSFTSPRMTGKKRGSTTPLRRATLAGLFQVAHQGGGGTGGFFDFGKRVDVGTGGAEFVGENIGVGGDDAEEIVEGVSDDLIFGEGDGHAVGVVEGKLHLRTFLKNELGLGVAEGRSHSGIQRIGSELVERDAA